ncbi:MAG: hypothetical protein ACI9HK_001587 [Pirellulaceae bacterium]|jgi:hypothetical protein
MNGKEGCAMLSRYTMYRRRPANAGPLPNGTRQDSRYRTRHVLRPPQTVVETYLESPSDETWQLFRETYLACLEQRYLEDPESFAKLAELAMAQDVYLGCSCPTKKNPDVRRCHTYLALEFMNEKFPTLDIEFPKS